MEEKSEERLKRVEEAERGALREEHKTTLGSEQRKSVVSVAMCGVHVSETRSLQERAASEKRRARG